jgi:hypothetical protein
MVKSENFQRKENTLSVQIVIKKLQLSTLLRLPPNYYRSATISKALLAALVQQIS